MPLHLYKMKTPLECTSSLRSFFRQSSDECSCVLIVFLFYKDVAAISVLFICVFIERCPRSSGYTYVPSLNLCYKVYEIMQNWTDAQATCETEDSQLIKVDTQQKMAYMKYNVLGKLYTVLQSVCCF